MSSKRVRIGFIPAVLAGFAATLFGGCTHADPAALEIFVADLLRNAASALTL